MDLAAQLFNKDPEYFTEDIPELFVAPDLEIPESELKQGEGKVNDAE
jgi:hypothetical protein